MLDTVKWKLAVRKDASASIPLMKASSSAVSVEDRRVTYTLSTADRDRHGDRITVKGWDIKRYKKNPVVLWSHVGDIPPIGKMVEVWKDADKLKGVVEFTPVGVNPFADMVFEIIKWQGFSANSVGFLPLIHTKDEGSDGEDMSRFFDPILFQKQELLEDSVVTVPANPFAIAEAKAAGIDVRPMGDFAARAIEAEIEAGPYYTRSSLEQIYRQVSGDAPVVVEVKESSVTAGTPEGYVPQAKSIEPATETVQPEQTEGDDMRTKRQAAIAEAKAAAEEVKAKAEALASTIKSGIEASLDELGEYIGEWHQAGLGCNDPELGSRLAQSASAMVEIAKAMGLEVKAEDEDMESEPEISPEPEVKTVAEPEINPDRETLLEVVRAVKQLRNEIKQARGELVDGE